MKQKKRYEEIMVLILNDENLYAALSVIDLHNQESVASILGGAIALVESNNEIRLSEGKIRALVPHIVSGIVGKNDFISKVVEEYRAFAIPALMGTNKF